VVVHGECRGRQIGVAGDLDGVDPLRAATRKYPDDPEAWFLLGEFYTHYGGNLLLEMEDARRAFGMRVDVFDPYVEEESLAAVGASKAADLDAAIDEDR